MSKINGNNLRNNLYKRNHARTFIIKSIITIVFILALLLMKKINLKPTNAFLENLKRNVKYNFSITEDGRKIYNKTNDLIDKSIDSIIALKENTTKYDAPILGTLHKRYGQDIKVNGKIFKNTGIEIKSTNKMDPKAVVSGYVSDIEMRDKKGYFVTIKSDNMDIVYGYLSKTYVEKGSTVEVGDIVGLLGTNKDGNQYLRIELYMDGVPVDPSDYIDL